MKDFQVPTSLRWCRDATRAMLRCIRLRQLIFQMIDELPSDRQAFYKAELRGVDTHTRALYDGRKLQKPHNETTTTQGTSSRPSGQSQLTE